MLGRTGVMLRKWLIFPHYRSKTLLCTLSNVPCIMKFSSLSCGNGYYFLAVCDCLALLPLILLGCFFPQLHIVASPTYTDHYSAEYSVRTLLRFSECSLHIAFSLLVFCPANSNCFNLQTLRPSPQLRASITLYLYFHHPWTAVCEVSQVSKLRQS